uniref:E3 ubiquitin protein ligase n=1 Tax=Paramoeba aestuarina TaxID=180227 RepID=A0A7S4KY00_9EUKA
MVDQQSTSPNKVELDEGTDLLEKQLAEKTKSSQSILLKIVQSLEAQRNQSEELSAMLRFDKDADSVQSALVDENKRLTEALAKSEQNLDMMHLRVKEMTEEKSKISDDLLLLKEQSRRWKKERDEINVKYQASIQKVDSLTLVPPPQLAMKRIKKEETSSSSSSSSSSSLASSQEKRLSVKKEKGVGGGEASATSEETEKLKIELEETKLLAEKRLNEINEIGSKYSSLVKSSESLKQSLGSMSGELVVSNPTFLETKKAAEFYQKEYNDVFNRYEGVKRETAALKRELEDQRLSFEDKIAQKIEEFAKIHREREAQMIMFRRERDALAWKLEERDAQPSQEDLIRELRVLTTSQAEHLKRLRGRLERGGGGCEDVDMASSSSPSSNSVSSSSNSNSSHLGEENQKLQNEVKELKSQITEWSKQEKKWSEKKRDMEILIDTYKKTGKDRRDVIEVKKNEKKLQEDCEELTKRVKELEEDIAGYKKVTSVDIRGSDPAMSQMQAEKDALSGEVKKLERKNAQLAKAKETQEEETKTLLMEIDEISKAYEEIQEQNDRLSSQVEEKNDATSRLVSERLKARKIQQRMTEENGLLQERESRLFEKIEVQHSLVRVTESKLKAMQELVFRLQEDVRGMQGAVEREKKNAKEEGERVADLQTRVDGLVGEIEDAKKESVERRVELEEKASVLRRVEEEKERLQRKVERANKSASLSKSSEVAEEEIKELRRQLQCDVCKDRRKGCIVTKCWHIFCRQCIEDSLTARRRKCPACGRAISRNEVQDIYL